MYFECQLVFKSYKPLELEKGMFFITEMMGSNLITQIEQVPHNQEEWISEHGYPVEPYIVDISSNDDAIVATPEQIGWFDEGDHSDELSDITVKNINDILEHFDGWVDVEMVETEEDSDEYVPILYENKVTIRVPQDYDDDSWDDNDEPNDDQIYNNFNHEGGIKH